MPVVCLPETLVELDVASAMAVDPPPGVELVYWSSGTPPRAGEIEMFVTPPLFTEPEVLATLPALRVVQTVSAGVDTVLDAIPDGVTLCDAEGVHGGAVAEWVLAATLAMVRELPRFVAEQARGRWATAQTGELAGARVLIVGAGDLGRNVGRRLAAFDAVTTLVARTAREGVHATHELPALLGDADVVVVLVPLTDETRGMIDADFLRAMRDGAILVNAARGPVVDTDALLGELRRGRLRAALDVTDPEPLPPEHALWSAPGVLVTPHVAGNVPAFPSRALALVRAQIARYVAGEPLANVVADGY